MKIEKHIISYVSNITGGSHQAAQQSIESAYEKGILPEEYVRFCCWEMSLEEQENLTSLLKQVHEYQRKQKEWLLRIAHRRSLRPMASLRKEMDHFNTLGLSPILYIQRGTYYPIRNKLTERKILQSNKPTAKNRVAKKDAYFQKICDITGWSPSKAEIEVTKAQLICGASYGNYYRFKLYNVSAQEQKSYLTREHRALMTIYFNQQLTNAFLDRKSHFNRIYAPYIKRKWFVNRNLTYSQFLKKIDGIDAVIAKPVSTTQGKGIRKFDCKNGDPKAIYNTIMAMPKSVVEEYIIQHPDIAAFCSSSVNTLRIVTLNARGTCNILFALIRMGQEGSIVDNVHSGGIAAGIDIQTGIINTEAVDMNGNRYSIHPGSNRPILGFQIPYWSAVLELCQKCYNKLPGVNLIGWDIAITPNGVDLIEGNSAPSFGSIQALHSEKGLKPFIVDPFLPDF